MRRKRGLGGTIGVILLATCAGGLVVGQVAASCSDVAGPSRHDRRPVPPPLPTAPDPDRANNYLNRIRFSGVRVTLDNISLLRLGGMACQRYAANEATTVADVLPDLYPFTRDQATSTIIATSAATDLCEGTGL